MKTNSFSKIKIAKLFTIIFFAAISTFLYISPQSAYSASRAKVAGDLIVRNRGNYVLLEGGVCFSGVTINNLGQFAIHTAERAFGPGTFKSVTKTTNFPYCDKADTRTGAPWPFRLRINLPAATEICEKGLRFSATNGFLLEEPLDLNGAVLDFCEKPTATNTPNPSPTSTSALPSSLTPTSAATTIQPGNCWQTCSDKKTASFPNGCSADLSCYEYNTGDPNNHCPQGQSNCCWAPKCGGAINCPISSTPTPTSVITSTVTASPTPTNLLTTTSTPTPTSTNTPTPAVCNFKAIAQVMEVTTNSSGGLNTRLMTEIDDSKKAQWAPQNNLSRQKIGDIRSNPSLSLKGFGVKYTDPGNGNVAVDTNTSYGGQVLVDYQNYPPLLPAGPVTAPDRYYRGDVASMYLNYPKDQYQVVGQYCISNNGMSTYCPASLMAVDPKTGLVGNFAISGADEAITGLRIDCNVDVTYGWYMKKIGTPPPPPPVACLLRDTTHLNKCTVKNVRTVPNASQSVNSHKVTLQWDAIRDTDCMNPSTDTYRLDIVEAGDAGVVCSRDLRESTDLLPNGTIQASCDLKGVAGTGKRENFVDGVPYIASVYVHKSAPDSCFSKESNYTFTRPEKDNPDPSGGGNGGGGSVEGCQVSRGETCVAHPESTNGQQYCGTDKTWVGWCSNASSGIHTSSCCRANSANPPGGGGTGGGGGGGENPPGGGGSGNQPGNPPGGGGGGGGGGQQPGPGNPPGGGQQPGQPNPEPQLCSLVNLKNDAKSAIDTIDKCIKTSNDKDLNCIINTYKNYSSKYSQCTNNCAAQLNIGNCQLCKDGKDPFCSKCFDSIITCVDNNSKKCELPIKSGGAGGKCASNSGECASDQTADSATKWGCPVPGVCCVSNNNKKQILQSVIPLEIKNTAWYNDFTITGIDIGFLHSDGLNYLLVNQEVGKLISTKNKIEKIDLRSNTKNISKFLDTKISNIKKSYISIKLGNLTLDKELPLDTSQMQTLLKETNLKINLEIADINAKAIPVKK